jgi:hypothetical protein
LFSSGLAHLSGLRQAFVVLSSANCSIVFSVEIKKLLAQYFMDKASDLADEIWEQKGLSEEAILGEHRRTPYPQSEQ